MIKAPVTMENVKLVMSLLAGKLQVKPFTTDISGGTLTLNLTVDGAKNPAPIALDLNENQVEAGSLMKVLTGSAVLSGGKVNMKIGVNGAGNSVRAIMAGLNGKLDATMGAGNIDNRFAKIMLADLFKLLSFGGGGDSSNLKCVVMRYDISHGLATTRQLAVETSGATIIGKGTINLATEGLDLHLVPYATSANLTALAIPVIVGGTMANPNVVPDAAAMASGTLNSVINAPSGLWDASATSWAASRGAARAAVRRRPPTPPRAAVPPPPLPPRLPRPSSRRRRHRRRRAPRGAAKSCPMWVAR